MAFAAAAYGVYLLATVGEEFDPRGRFGIYALLAAAVMALLAAFGWWRQRR